MLSGFVLTFILRSFCVDITSPIHHRCAVTQV
jgi:hypothetical protein